MKVVLYFIKLLIVAALIVIYEIVKTASYVYIAQGFIGFIKKKFKKRRKNQPMNCKECNHFDVCWRVKEVNCGNPMITNFELCNKAQRKESVTEFPCEIGDVVYLAVRGKVTQCEVVDMSYHARFKKTMLDLKSEDDWFCSVNYEYEFGYSLFFEWKQAEDAAKKYREEMKKK